MPVVQIFLSMDSERLKKSWRNKKSKCHDGESVSDYERTEAGLRITLSLNLNRTKQDVTSLLSEMF